MDKLKSFVSQIGDRARYDVLNVTPGPSSPTVEHQEAEGFLCPICHQAFSVPEQLQRHFDDMHEEDPGSSNGDIASLRHEVKGLTLSLQEERDLLKAEVERLSKQNEVLMKQGGDFLKLQEKTRQETLPLHVSLKEAVEEAALLRAAKQEVELKAVELAKRNADLSAKVDLLESQITERHQVNVGSESELKKEVERLETDMMTREAEFERAKVRWEVQLRDALEQKTEEFSQRREEELGTAREEMQKILEQKDAEVERIRRDKDAEIKRLEEGNSSRQNDLKELREAHDSNLKQQQKMFEEKIETISKQLAAKEEEKRDAVETLKERFQKERSSAQMQIAKSQQLLSQVQADLKSQLEERAAKIDKLTRDLEERTLALERSNKDLASTSSRVQLLEKEKEELVKKIEIGEGDMTLVHQLQTEITQSNQRWTEERSDLMLELDGLRDQVSNLRRQEDELKQQLNKKDEERKEDVSLMAALEAELSSLKDVGREVEALKEESKIRDQKHQSEKEDFSLELQSLKSQLVEAWEEVSRKSSEREEMENCLKSKLHSKEVELRGKVEEVIALHRSVADGERGKAELLTSSEEKDQEIRRLSEELKHRETELSSAEGNVLQLQEAVSHLEKELLVKDTELEEEKESLAALSQTEADLNRCVEDLKYDVSSGKSALKTKEEALHKLEEQLQKNVQQNENLLQKNAELTKSWEEKSRQWSAERDDLESHLRETQESVRILSKEKSDCEKEVVELAQRLQDAEDSLRNAQKEVDAVQLEGTRRLKEVTEKFQKEISSLRNAHEEDVAKALERSNTLEKSLRRAEAEVEELKSLAEARETEREQHQKDVMKLQEQIRDLEMEAEKTVLRQELDLCSLREENDGLRESVKNKEAEVVEWKTKSDELAGRGLEMEARLSSATDERRVLLDRCLQGEGELERVKTSSVELRRKLDDTEAALQELGRENQGLQIELAKLTGRKWADDSDVHHCQGCQKEFSLTFRKHHCRSCGQIFCAECSGKSATLPSYKKPQRVCDTCYIEIHK